MSSKAWMLKKVEHVNVLVNVGEESIAMKARRYVQLSLYGFPHMNIPFLFLCVLEFVFPSQTNEQKQMNCQEAKYQDKTPNLSHILLSIFSSYICNLLVLAAVDEAVLMGNIAHSAWNLLPAKRPSL